MTEKGTLLNLLCHCDSPFGKRLFRYLILTFYYLFICLLHLPTSSDLMSKKGGGFAARFGKPRISTRVWMVLLFSLLLICLRPVVLIGFTAVEELDDSFIVSDMKAYLAQLPDLERKLAQVSQSINKVFAISSHLFDMVSLIAINYRRYLDQ